MCLLLLRLFEDVLLLLLLLLLLVELLDIWLELDEVEDDEDP